MSRLVLFLGLSNARRVDTLLGVALLVAVVTGLVSWGIGTGWARVVTVTHAVAGLSVVVLIPAKLRGSVRTGMRRRRITRWLSLLMGLLVVAVITLGLLHATGLWHGVGYWSALWTHVLLAAVVAPLAAWHVLSRRSRPRRIDLNRRTLLTGGAVTVAAAIAYTGQELAAGADRKPTGSHEISSFDPSGMPVVQWLNDRAPARQSPWNLTVLGTQVPLEWLQANATTLEADLDCTGGWWSRQAWLVVTLDEVLAHVGVSGSQARSVNVISATGYSRLLPLRDLPNLYLCVGYGDQALRRGHGGPVRLVAPNRRGFWWVKWVTRIDPSARPWWLQSPFPLE